MSDLKINGTITKLLPAENGTSAKGKSWTKQSFILDTGASYNPEICLGMFGIDKVEQLNNYSAGDKVEVFFNIQSREFNNKWYTNLDCWKINGKVSREVGTEDVTLEDKESEDIPF